MKEIEDMFPVQEKGAKSSTTYMREGKNLQEAMAIFSIAESRLFDISKWKKFCGAGAEFTLFTASGAPATGHPEKGDYIRISIPAVPGPNAGDGYEWVAVEAIVTSKESNFTALKVRPANPPFLKTHSIPHFFTSDATSTFCVARSDRKVVAMVSGRNEVPNTAAERLFDRIRNLFMGLGAMLGLNKPQWMLLVRGLLK